MGYGFKGTLGRHNWRVATGRPEGRGSAGSQRASIYQYGRYEARILELARADRLDRERAHAERQRQLANERRRKEAAEAKERQLMVREDRPVPLTPSGPSSNSGGPPQFVQTHGATRTAVLLEGAAGAEPEAKIQLGALVDALHEEDYDAAMNAVSALLTARRVIGTSSLDDASAPSKGSRAAPVDVDLAPLLDDAGVASKSSSRAQAARTTSHLACAAASACLLWSSLSSPNF